MVPGCDVSPLIQTIDENGEASSMHYTMLIGPTRLCLSSGTNVFLRTISAAQVYFYKFDQPRWSASSRPLVLVEILEPRFLVDVGTLAFLPPFLVIFTFGGAMFKQQLAHR